MAVDDGERLVVLLEARIKDFERNLQKANKTAAKNFGDIERRGQQSAIRLESSFAKAGASIGAGFKSMGLGLAAGFGASELIKLADGHTRIQNSLKVTGLAGTQLTTVYDQLFASAQKNMAPIEALVQLYSRLSLVQGQLGISSDQLIGFTDKIALALRVGGTSAEAAGGSLMQLSQALGSGTVRAEEFNSVVEGTPTIALAVAKGLTAAGGSVAKLRALVIAGKVSSKEFFDGFIVGSQDMAAKVKDAQSTFGQSMTTINNALTDAVGKIDGASGATKFLNRYLGDIAESIETLGKTADTFAVPLGLVVTLLEAASKAQNIFGDGAMSLTAKVNPLATALATVYELLKGIANESRNGIAFRGVPRDIGVDQTGDHASKPSTGGPARYKFEGIDSKAQADMDRDAASAAKAAADAKQQQIDAINGALSALQFEGEQLGRTADQQAVYNALKDAGVTLDSKAGQQIRDEVEILNARKAAIDANEAAQTKLKAAQADFNESIKYLESSGVDSFYSMVTGAESAADAISGLADQLAKAGIQAALLGTGPLAGLFGTQDSGGLLSSLFSGATASAKGNVFDHGAPVQAFATGGTFANGIASRPTMAPMALFGEAGPEAIVPLKRLPSGDLGVQTAPARGSSVAPSQTINVSSNVTVSASGGTGAQNKDLADQVQTQVTRQIRGLIASELRQQMRQGGLLAR